MSISITIHGETSEDIRKHLQFLMSTTSGGHSPLSEINLRPAIYLSKETMPVKMSPPADNSG